MYREDMRGYFLYPDDLPELHTLIHCHRSHDAGELLNCRGDYRMQNLAILPDKFSLFWDYLATETNVRFPFKDSRSWSFPRGLLFEPLSGWPVAIFNNENGHRCLTEFQHKLADQEWIWAERAYIGVAPGMFTKSEEFLLKTIKTCVTENLCFMLWSGVSDV